MTSNENQSEIEGYEDQSGESLDLGEYPIESLLIRQEARTISGVISRIEKQRYILDPDFQREYIWDTKKASKLIESVLMRIPIPVFYLAEREDGKVIIVDGLQRLTSFFRYVNNKFSLTDLVNENLNTKKFSELPIAYQERIEDTNLIFYLIDPKVPEKVRLDIFDRVNSGVPLTRQQMRNSLFNGNSTRWLRDMAGKQIFKDVTTSESSLNPKLMRDREFINRFCAFLLIGEQEYSNPETIKGDMDTFLASALKKMNAMSSNDLHVLEKVFLRSMENNYTIFHNYAFRRHNSLRESRSVINASLFDVFSVIMSYIPIDRVKQDSKILHEKFVELMHDKNFIQSITSGTSDVKNVKTRFGIAKEKYKGYFDDKLITFKTI